MSGDYGKLRGTTAVVSGVIYVLAPVAAAPVAILLAVRLRGGHYGEALTAGLLLLGLLLLAAVWRVLAGVIRAVADSAEELDRLHRTTRAVHERQAQMEADQLRRLDELLHWTAMSEAIRSLLNTKRETEVFSQQIGATIAQEDWSEATRLIELFREHFKDHARADALAEQLASARQTAGDRVMRARIAEVGGLIDQQNFLAADMAMRKLAADYPGDARLESLESTCQKARRRYTQASREKFTSLLAEGRLEEASAIIDDLAWNDADVTQEMRSAWREASRRVHHVAKEALAACIRDKQWVKALAEAEDILRRFPETLLANEVRKLIDMVRQRAEAETAAEAQKQ